MPVSVQSIRFGIISRGSELTSWQAKCVQQAVAVDGVELALVVIESPGQSTGSGEDASQSGAGRRPPRWGVSQPWLHDGPVSLLPSAGAGIPGEVEVMRCSSTHAGDGEIEFKAAAVAAIADLKLDFLVHFGPDLLAGEIRDAATRGIWALQLGEAEFTDGPPGFWEILLGRPTTTVSLCRLGGGGSQDTVLRQARFRTLDASYRGQSEMMLREGSRLLAQACRDLMSGPPPGGTGAAPAQAVTRGMPGFLDCLKFNLLLRRNKIRNLYRHFITHRHWGLAISFSPVEDLWRRPLESRVFFLPGAARNTFHADPFGFEDNEGLAILHEQWSNESMSGGIAGVHIDRSELAQLRSGTRPEDGGGIGARSIPVNISHSHHCSYPYIFRHEGQNYCVPETAEGNRVCLYRQSEEPGDWVYVCDLIEGFPAVDSTVIHYQGRWWLFCTRLDDSPDSHLYLWYADELSGPWRQHHNNPVKMDVCSSRPAGTPFEHDGALYRPAQDCSANYGGAISIQKIVELNPERFTEEYCGDLNALADSIGVDGMHTLSVVGDWTLLDYYRTAFLPGIFIYRLKLYWRARRNR